MPIRNHIILSVRHPHVSLNYAERFVFDALAQAWLRRGVADYWVYISRRWSRNHPRRYKAFDGPVRRAYLQRAFDQLAIRARTRPTVSVVMRGTSHQWRHPEHVVVTTRPLTGGELYEANTGAPCEGVLVNTGGSSR